MDHKIFEYGHFSHSVCIEDVRTQRNQNVSSKAIQATDIPVKVIKRNSNILQNKYALISMNLLVKENYKLLEISQYHTCFQERCTYF